MVVVLFVLLACIVSYIFVNPTSKLNPFPPPAEATEELLPTVNRTTQMSMVSRTATIEPSPTPTELATNTPTTEPSATLTPTPEPTPVDGNAHNPATTPIPTKVLNDPYPFTLQGEPKLLDASTFNPSHGCNWQGVAGQTFDLLNRPLPGILVQVSGQLGTETLKMISMSGTVLTYGESGYEIFLDDQITESHETLSIRLIDEEGQALSEVYQLDTSAACNQNLVVVNFKKVK